VSKIELSRYEDMEIKEITTFIFSLYNGDGSCGASENTYNQLSKFFEDNKIHNKQVELKINKND